MRAKVKAKVKARAEARVSLVPKLNSCHYLQNSDKNEPSLTNFEVEA